MAEPRDTVDLALLLVEYLEREKIEYALGGALALGFWGIPRGTLDVDVTVFLALAEFHRLNTLLEAMGCTFVFQEARQQAEERGTFSVTCSGMRAVTHPCLPVCVLFGIISAFESASLYVFPSAIFAK